MMSLGTPRKLATVLVHCEQEQQQEIVGMLERAPIHVEVLVSSSIQAALEQVERCEFVDALVTKLGTGDG